MNTIKGKAEFWFNLIVTIMVIGGLLMAWIYPTGNSCKEMREWSIGNSFISAKGTYCARRK